MEERRTIPFVSSDAFLHPKTEIFIARYARHIYGDRMFRTSNKHERL
jgi:hypothetical protein